MNNEMIKISGIVKNSIVDGIGVRYVIFTQGCSHNCHGCHNPETHDFNGGYYMSVDDIMSDIDKYIIGIRGITLSGGDPLYPLNRKAVTYLCKRFKEKYPYQTIWLYTGYTIEQLDLSENIFKYVDVLVDGPFIESLLDEKRVLLGSTNKNLTFITERYKDCADYFNNPVSIEEITAEDYIFINGD